MISLIILMVLKKYGTLMGKNFAYKQTESLFEPVTFLLPL